MMDYLNTPMFFIPFLLFRENCVYNVVSKIYELFKFY